jgi:hypothetical protein
VHAQPKHPSMYRNACNGLSKNSKFHRVHAAPSHCMALGSTEGVFKNVRPVLRFLEGKASAPLARGAYTPVCEDDKRGENVAACLPSLLRRNGFGYEGRELRRRHRSCGEEYSWSNRLKGFVDGITLWF